MQIANFRYFLAVAECGSVRQAADAMNVSASAISRQIQNLEFEFSAPLFERRVRGMELTEEGKVLKRHMQRTMRELELAKSQIDHLHGLQKGEVSYATIDGVASPMLLPAIAEFQSSYPGIQFSGRIDASERVHSKVTSDEVDFGVALLIRENPDIEIAMQFETKFKVVIPHGHDLADQRQIPLEQLAAHPLTLLNDDFESTRILKRSFRDRSLDFTMTQELDNVEMVKQYARLSNTLTVLPDFALQGNLEPRGLLVADMESTYPVCTTVLFTRKGRRQTHAASRFLDYVKSHQSTDFSQTISVGIHA